MSKKNSKYTIINFTREIFIVVIGIFIAFQLNNWNEKIKNTNEEIKSLELIKKDLETEKSFFNFIKSDFRKGINYLSKISSGGESNFDSLVYYLEKEFFHPQLNSSYINLKYGGKLNIISNDNLKNKIISFYEANYGYYDAFAESHKAFVYKDIRTYNLQNIKVDDNLITRDEIIPKLLKENHLINLINYQVYTFKTIEERLNVELVNILIKEIEDEIKLLN